MDKWTFWIDCGGTFTDIIAVKESGEYRVHKVLSHSPHYESAVVHGIKEVLGHTNFKDSISEVRLGTTVATNAFLEKNGNPCAFVTTLGHRDVLEIRQQNRPELFDINIKKTPTYYSYVAHVQGRLNADGSELIPFDEEIARFELQRILDKGIRSLAVAFMHSTINPSHEVRLGEVAIEMGFEYISLSHKVSPKAKFIARADTTVMDAYLSPYLKQYTQSLEKDLGITNIFYMQSDGTLCKGNELKGYNALLSGPAGGLIGAIDIAKAHDIDKVITFDMGGTSTDVALFDGVLQINPEPNFYGIKLLAPMVDIHTVAAGGGSILSYDNGRFKVGPESARAYPGPACYRNGGPLTVTDANLFLKRIEAENFPKIFGKNQNQPLDEDIVVKKFQEIAFEASLSAKEVAEGFIEVAVEIMSKAIRKISIERGYDPKEFTLISFGGAGGQLASKVAQNLGMTKVLIHPLSSVLSAYGMGFASKGHTLRAKPDNSFRNIEQKLTQKYNSQPLVFKRFYALKDKGSDHSVEFFADKIDEAKQLFSSYYKKTFGIEYLGEVECENIGVKALVQNDHKDLVYPINDQKTLLGPNIISKNNTAIFIENGWELVQNSKGVIKLTQVKKVETKEFIDEKIELEIFYQKFQFIAQVMGFTLQKLAFSINIKERNDFSCALFTKAGELIANAPHIPVHLGSMADAVKAVKNNFIPRDGDSYLCNDPNNGGTHLPDLTVITPVFYQDELVLWVASRGHHADIGGITPGSMPGNSKILEEEGVIISPLKFVEKEKFLNHLLEDVLTKNKYPVRNYQQNLHDIKAKLAANIKGKNELIDLFDSYSASKVLKMSENLLSYTAIKAYELLSSFNGVTGYKKIADNREIHVSLSKIGEKFCIDFEGTSSATEDNFNTPLPVVKASVLFVLRSLINENIPLNDGILRVLDIKVPKDCLLNPKDISAIVAGNVETSQVICDVLFSAFSVQANSQGTMNNFSFGNKNYQYYETIAGGAGASYNASGASGVQVNMTNSLLTDPEVFESRYPARVDLMGLRHGSGGKGEYNGGDGLQRKITFLEDMEVSFLSQSRKFPPLGINEGGKAQRGQNLLERDNELIEIEENISFKVKAAESISINTPGGGGYGKQRQKPRNLVFGFGSNMDLFQIKNRCPSAILVKRALVYDYEIRYTRFSQARGGGVADMYSAPGHKVWGLIVDINDEDLSHLDQIECGNMGYKRITYNVYDDNGDELKVYAYDVIDKKPDIPPTKIYEWLVYSGAYNLNTPHYYLNHIKSFREPNE